MSTQSTRQYFMSIFFNFFDTLWARVDGIDISKPIINNMKSRFYKSESI